MIKSIALTNFQNHKFSELEFDNGLNVIKGTSDSGKSAVLRALIWVIKNRPSGDSVKNWHCKKGGAVEVDIELSNDIFINKKRVDGKASYSLTAKGGVKTFEAIRQDVPGEIEDAFNISDINIQSQHDPYFLLNDSPGEVAQKLNKIVGLDIIDKLFKTMNSRINTIKGDLERETARAKELEQKITGLDYVDSLEIWVQELSDMVNKCEQQEKDVGFVEVMLSQIGEERSGIRALDILISIDENVDAILSLYDKYSVLSKAHASILGIVNNLRSTENQLIDESEWLNVEKPCKELNSMISGLIQKREEDNMVSSIYKVIRDAKKSLSETESLTDSLSKEYRVLLEKHGICPLCGSKINSKLILNEI